MSNQPIHNDITEISRDIMCLELLKKRLENNLDEINRDIQECSEQGFLKDVVFLEVIKARFLTDVYEMNQDIADMKVRRKQIMKSNIIRQA